MSESLKFGFNFRTSFISIDLPSSLIRIFDQRSASPIEIQIDVGEKVFFVDWFSPPCETSERGSGLEQELADRSQHESVIGTFCVTRDKESFVLTNYSQEHLYVSPDARKVTANPGLLTGLSTGKYPGHFDVLTSYSAARGMAHPYLYGSDGTLCVPPMHSFASEDSSSWKLSIRPLEIFIHKFHGQSAGARNPARAELLKKYLLEAVRRSLVGVKEVMIPLSGMDSLLAALVAIEANDAEVSPRRISLVHVDISKHHYFGALQRDISRSFAEALSDRAEYTELSLDESAKLNPETLDKVIAIDAVPRLAPDPPWVDTTLQRYRENQVNPALEIRGDGTSLYQPFNGTLDFLQFWPLSELLGMWRRIKFGALGITLRWGILFLTHWKETPKDRLVRLVASQELASSNGTYTDKRINWKAVENPPNQAAVDVYMFLAEHWLSASANRALPIHFLAFVRDITFYGQICRENQLTQPDNWRFSLMESPNSRWLLGHANMTALDYIVPKRLIRQTIKLFHFSLVPHVISARIPWGLRTLWLLSSLEEILGFRLRPSRGLRAATRRFLSRFTTSR